MFPKGSGCGIPCDGPCGYEHRELFSIEVGEIPTGRTALVVNECDEIITVMPLTRPAIVTMCYTCIEQLLPQHRPRPATTAA